MMSSSQTPVGFTIQELYTRILPGLVIVVAFFSPRIIATIDGASLEFPLEFTNIILLTGLLSLVAGEFINTSRELATVPHWFKLIAYNGTGDKSKLGRRQRIILWLRPQSVHQTVDYLITDITDSTTMEGDLYRNICKNLGFKPESVESRILYMGLMNHMDRRMSSLTKRHHMNYMFVENVWIALIAGIVWNLVILGMSMITDSVSMAISSFIVLFFLLLILIIWLVVSSMASGLYLQYLLIDYIYSNKDSY